MNKSKKQKKASHMSEKDKKELAGVFSAITNTSLMCEFLEDILTPAEFDAMVLRWQIIKQLSAGVNQRTISGNLGVSIGTITRGSRELRNKQGGFAQVLNKRHSSR